MRFILPLLALTLAFFLLQGSETRAQGLDLQSYCESNFGGNAILLDESDGYSWRCSVGDDMYDMSIQQACDQQYGGGYQAQLGKRRDPYSWGCY